VSSLHGAQPLPAPAPGGTGPGTPGSPGNNPSPVTPKNPPGGPSGPPGGTPPRPLPPVALLDQVIALFQTGLEELDRLFE
jgi:hypothetical protein